MEINSLAIEKNAPTIVQWQDGTYVHISIFNYDAQSRPVHMRCTLSCNSKNGQLNCQCGQQNYFCIHRAVGLWFFHQTNQLTSPTNNSTDNEVVADTYSDDEDNPSEPSKANSFGNFVYPPEDGNGVSKMCYYLQKQANPSTYSAIFKVCCK